MIEASGPHQAEASRGIVLTRGQNLRAEARRQSPQDAPSCSQYRTAPDSGNSPSPQGTANRSAQKVLPDTLPSISLAQFHPLALGMLFYEETQRRRHLSLINPQVIL